MNASPAGSAGRDPVASHGAPAARELAIVPSDADRTFADAHHARFLEYPGSNHIAGRSALAYLSALLNQTKPKAVLELGAGIGTMTEILLGHPSRIERIVSTENNAFCLASLKKNQANPAEPRLLVATKEGDVPRDVVFDLLIGDGGFNASGVYEDYAPQLKLGSVVFVEGDRANLRNQLIANLAKRGLTLAFREYGVRFEKRWRPFLGRLERLGIKISLNRNTRIKGCWIGLVS
jgi:protein-L-isoaspartate O-methyltransferase